ncbi:flagellar assembly protein A [Candidatus Omnitrophota bacterium]
MSENKNTTPSDPTRDVNVLIDVSRDKFEAELMVIPLTDTPKLSVEQIMADLKAKGIKYGILDDAIAKLVQDKIFEKKELVAAGRRPLEGTDGKIEYFVETNVPQKITKGDNIGKIVQPVKGEEGINVFGEKVPVAEEKRVDMPKFVHVDYIGKENLMVAAIDGYLTIEGATIEISPFFTLKVSDNNYEAYVTVTNFAGDGELSATDLTAFLNDEGVIYGILQSEVERIFTEGIFGQEVLVAQGKEVEHGKDGTITYFFPTEVMIASDEQGNVDYKELNVVHTVNVGEKLAELISPQEGNEGFTVYGKTIQPEKGKIPSLPMGKNTQPDPNDPSVLISTIEGCVTYSHNIVTVEEVFVVSNNVDYSTGNIHFIGSVVVQGDVKSGFKISSSRDVQINGIVEDASIECGGNVLLKKGFIGKGHGRIIARGEVIAKYCENQTIIADGDVNISDYAMNCTIKTRGHLFVKEKTGLIVGHESYAVKGIEAKTVGSESFTYTKLFAGVDEVLNAYLEINIGQIEHIDETIVKYNRRKLVKKELTESVKRLYAQLLHLKKEKEDKRKLLLEELDNLDSRKEEFKASYIKITGTVYPGTTLKVYDRIIKISDPRNDVFFSCKEEEEGEISDSPN